MAKTTAEKREYMRAWRAAHPDYYGNYARNRREGTAQPKLVRTTYAGKPVMTQEQAREATRRSRQLRYQLQREYLRNLKAATACADCGVTYAYYVMQFDHVRGTKDFELSRYAGGWHRLQDEIEKCDVVCAKCHAERSQSRLQH